MDGVRPLTDWAAELRAFRLRNGFKQEAAASLLGVSQAYISRVENGAVEASGEFAQRLQSLLCEPDHTPMIDFLKSIVRDTPTLTCLLSLRNDRLHIEERSQACIAYGPPFDTQIPDSFADLAPTQAHGAAALEEVVKAGAFEGRIRLAETVWKATLGSGEVRAFNSLNHTLRDDSGRWLLHSTSIPISPEQVEFAIKAWDGPVRLFSHGMARPDTWPGRPYTDQTMTGHGQAVSLAKD